MPRRRSYGLTFSAAFNAVTASLALLAAAGCQAGPTDNGCQIAKQAVLPGTMPLALLPEIRVERLGTTTVVLGSDTASVRWVTIAQDGTLGTEQSVALPPDTLKAFYALAGVDAPGDQVVIAVLLPAANGTDAELRLVIAPTDGSPAGAPGVAIATFGGGLGTPPQVAMGTSQSGMYAGLAWIEPGQLPRYALLDGQGEIVGGQPANVEGGLPAPGYSCLGFAPGKDELTVTYQKVSVNAALGPTWFIADVKVNGYITTLSLNVAPGETATMSCARTVLYDNGGSPDYAIVWQDTSGSWLSVYYGAPQDSVTSYPFASSTDFGGPDLQPLLVGLATFVGNDFGVLFTRAHSVELWRVDWVGNVRSGVLILPSLEGDVGNVASVASPSLITSTYADYTGQDSGRRLVIDATCY